MYIVDTENGMNRVYSEVSEIFNLMDKDDEKRGRSNVRSMTKAELESEYIKPKEQKCEN